ncbi:MAG: hypothetical protein LBN30_03770 [Oscillospiraceae bacterium]|jgi:acetyl-CoA carboxylase beta subunit|nr:hypothetical protein [Oscillospiraceae bacterium]
MNEITVRTKEEFKSAVQSKAEKIIVTDKKLAKTLKQAYDMKNVGKVAAALATLSTATAVYLASIPLTGGTSAAFGGGALFAITAAEAALLGTSAAGLIFVGYLGAGMFIALKNGYNVRMYKGDMGCEFIKR